MVYQLGVKVLVMVMVVDVLQAKLKAWWRMKDYHAIFIIIVICDTLRFIQKQKMFIDCSAAAHHFLLHGHAVIVQVHH